MALTKVTTGVVDDSVFAANKNAIINGNFDIWQRGTSFTSATSSIYAADRWQWFHSGTGVVDILQSTSVPDNTSDFSFQVDVTTADASIAAGDFYVFSYKVEGHDNLRFAFGASDAKQLTLSFWVKSSKTGIHCVTFRNDGLSRSYIVEYTVDIADTWEQKSITLTADTTGTWLTDNSTGMSILWALAVGTTFHNTANTWNASNSASTSNQVNVMDSAANNFHISRVQVELGSVATEFERRSFAQELAMAQRYTMLLEIGQDHNGDQNASTVFRYYEFPTELRSVPTASIFSQFSYFSGGGSVNFTPTFSIVATTGITIKGTGLTLGRGFVNGTALIDAEL